MARSWMQSEKRYVSRDLGYMSVRENSVGEQQNKMSVAQCSWQIDIRGSDVWK
jgi:hypothetical protein